jgi:hypothetical protein
MDHGRVVELSIELAPLVQKRDEGTLTDAESGRLDEIVAMLTAAGVSVNLTIKDVTPMRPFVPKGCVLGDDRIIRPGVFEERYRREVMHRGQSDARYRAEALAFFRLARGAGVLPACSRSASSGRACSGAPRGRSEVSPHAGAGRTRPRATIRRRPART